MTCSTTSVAIATFGEAATTELALRQHVTLEHVETTLPNYALESDAHTYPSPTRMMEPARSGERTRFRQYPGHEVSDWAARFGRTHRNRSIRWR
jgi:hypothetical protein